MVDGVGHYDLRTARHTFFQDLAGGMRIVRVIGRAGAPFREEPDAGLSIPAIPPSRSDRCMLRRRLRGAVVRQCLLVGRHFDQLDSDMGFADDALRFLQSEQPEQRRMYEEVEQR